MNDTCELNMSDLDNVSGGIGPLAAIGIAVAAGLIEKGIEKLAGAIADNPQGNLQNVFTWAQNQPH
jgi:hypothetical protein